MESTANDRQKTATSHAEEEIRGPEANTEDQRGTVTGSSVSRDAADPISHTSPNDPTIPMTTTE